jgi:syntaxin 16
MVNFETDEAQQEQEIEYATQEITEIFRHAEGLLKRFSAQQHGVDDSEAMVRVNIQRSIAKKLQGLSMNFRGTQKDYLNKLKAQKSESGAVFEFENQKAKQTPFDQDMGFTSQQMQMADDMSELVDQRDQEIANIAKSIEELAQIFKELAVLVIDQGTILDRIDFNMESAVEHAKEGIVQLEKAEESQKNALPLRCIILLVFLCTLMLILLIVKHSGK